MVHISNLRCLFLFLYTQSNYYATQYFLHSNVRRHAYRIALHTLLAPSAKPTYSSTWLCGQHSRVGPAEFTRQLHYPTDTAARLDRPLALNSSGFGLIDFQAQSILQLCCYMENFFYIYIFQSHCLSFFPTDYQFCLLPSLPWTLKSFHLDSFSLSRMAALIFPVFLSVGIYLFYFLGSTYSASRFSS